MKKLAIFGASGHGKVVADIALVSGWDSVVFFDDAWPDIRQNGVWSVEGDTSALLDRQNDFEGMVVAIGDCNIRWEKQLLLSQAGGSLVTIVHPSAFISPYAQIGVGVVVMAGAVVNAYAKLGDSCVINTGAIVEHDCVLAHAVHLAPRVVLSGSVDISAFTWVGVGAVVRQGTQIGEGVTVGAGAVVVKPVMDAQTVVGCPASVLIKK